MNIRLVEDIKSVTELKVHLREVLAQVHATGRPVIITVNGKPDAVLMDAGEFERQQQALNLAALLAEGEADVRAGRTRPAADYLKELEGGRPVSRRHRGKRRA